MTNLATYTQIAQLVKSWADTIDRTGPGIEWETVSDLADQMRAFSNGLMSTVDAFAPIVAELNKIVADDNVVEHNNQFGK